LWDPENEAKGRADMTLYRSPNGGPGHKITALIVVVALLAGCTGTSDTGG
jgi:hypothetical protein